MKQRLQNILYWWAGLLILILNKPRHQLQGYTRPRKFPVTKFDLVVEYDLKVIGNWMKYGKKYQGNNFSWKNCSILELGPGADFGVGITLLATGAKSYHALDVNPLALSTPNKLYEILEHQLILNGFVSKQKLNIQTLKNKIDYVCDKKFNITHFNNQGINLVLSNAAFEHFSDIPRTIEQLSIIMESGGILIAEVDLQTHSRWIRETDPLNIYRYPEWLYKLLSFSGSPNRIRPETYKNLLEKNGWENIVIYPKIILPENAVETVRPSMSKRFKKEKDSLGWLSIVICATKKK
ncbi:methyltransferase domain-containing protein [Candidatus Falkowbacteria bacterium]|nr:MAG: methyltransferase domain-containing protein [Candidatus Falkowbacteria bacterium]